MIVAPPGWEEPSILLAEEIACTKVSACVAGGPTRTDSVRAGLAEVPADAAAVLVHDAARPLVSDDVVRRVLAPLAEGWDGVVPALPVADTIKRVRAGQVVETLPRDELAAARTPQAFVASALRAALAHAPAGTTDCASALEQRGGRIRVVPGDPWLLKVTTRDDLALVAGRL